MDRERASARDAMKYNLSYKTRREPEVMDFGSIGKVDFGFLTFAQENLNLPFEIKRVYWTYSAPENILRGHHAHRRLEQLLFAVSGKIEIEVEGPHRKKSKFILDSPQYGLYIPPLTWRTLKFSKDAVLLCLASLNYDEQEYIRHYEEFEDLCLQYREQL